ncbi:hypothetical protein E2C01_078484 [Portunus trituberculatus]|uniref:Uncharacterized protein n=1 Tax=Portunus trituberculatus TaxID=210409 RepID=A0A5B7ISW6_PORTR|nr:hypothetical protein [Portunus trituberculatus]
MQVNTKTCLTPLRTRAKCRSSVTQHHSRRDLSAQRYLPFKTHKSFTSPSLPSHTRFPAPRGSRGFLEGRDHAKP